MSVMRFCNDQTFRMFLMVGRQLFSQLDWEGSQEGKARVVSGLLRATNNTSLERQLTNSDHLELPVAGVARTGALVPGGTLELTDNLLDQRFPLSSHKW